MVNIPKLEETKEVKYLFLLVSFTVFSTVPSDSPPQNVAVFISCLCIF